jgi:hypothetical protein
MATDFDTARSQYEMYRFCYDNGHDAWVRKARQCFDFWNSKQWDPAVKARLEREGRPALTLNVIESLIRAMKGMQRALRNDVRFAPTQDATIGSAQVHDAIWLHTQNENNYEFRETEMYEKGLIMSRAYVDVRVSYDASTQGDIVLRGRRSQDVILDPSIEDYDPDEWPRVFTRRWVSHNDIRDLFGKDAAEACGYSSMPAWLDYEDVFLAQQMGSLPYYAAGAMDPDAVRGLLLLDHQYFVTKNKDVFIDVDTGDFSEVPETWDRNRVSHVLQQTPGLITMKRKVKTVRWDVTCEGQTLHSEDSPYKHFTIVPFFPTFVDGVTKGAVEDLIDPQQLYNKITSSELHIISTTANSGYKLKHGSLKNMSVEQLEERGSKAGFIAELADVQDLEKIQPNQTPQGHDRLSFKADQIMRQLAGVPDSGRGFARDDASGSKVMQDQAAQDINCAGWLSNLHRTKQLVAMRVLDCAQAHYTETRTIMINRGTALVPNVDTVTINQPTDEGKMLNDVTRGKYSTVLVPAPSRTTMAEGDFQLLVSLREKIGIAIPDSMLIELSPAANKSQIIQAIGGGPDSNDRQRQAEELAAQQQAIDQQKATAIAQKEESAARLNQARAEKASVEAASDPDASYERVENARIASEHENNQAKLELQRRTLDETRRKNTQDAAIRMAELDIHRESADADRASAEEQAKVAKQENRPAKRKGK